MSLFALLLFVGAAATAQATTVTCKDGTSSKGGQGACSGHGGVKADVKADAKAAKADAKADAKVAKGAADAKVAKADAKADAKAAKIEADAKAAKADVKSDAKVAKADAKAAKIEADAKAAKAEAKADAKVAKADAKSAAKAPAKAEGAATAMCVDKTLSYSKTHQGACSGHGGVKEWLDGTGKKN